jgi:hypothetical protein
MQRSLIPKCAYSTVCLSNCSEKGAAELDGCPVIATIDGQLVQYSPNLEHTIRENCTLGPITALISGNVINCSSGEKRLLLAVTAEGKAFVFKQNLVLMFTFNVPPNVVALGLADIDRDGMVEVLLGLHNCALHAFRLSVIEGNLDVQQVLGSPVITLPAQTWSVHMFGERLALNLGFQTILADPIGKSTIALPNFGLHSVCVLKRNEQELLLRFSADGAVEALNINNEKVWSDQLEGTLMISQDVTISGKKILVLCSWEGIAWVITEEWNVFRMNLGESVLSLLAFEHQGALSLFYVTISRNVVVLGGIDVYKLA